ncbi:neutral amino acid transporter, partial [Quaeritorhiza haematococci]
ETQAGPSQNTPSSRSPSGPRSYGTLDTLGTRQETINANANPPRSLLGRPSDFANASPNSAAPVVNPTSTGTYNTEHRAVRRPQSYSNLNPNIVPAPPSVTRSPSNGSNGSGAGSISGRAVPRRASASALAREFYAQRSRTSSRSPTRSSNGNGGASNNGVAQSLPRAIPIRRNNSSNGLLGLGGASGQRNSPGAVNISNRAGVSGTAPGAFIFSTPRSLSPGHHSPHRRLLIGASGSQYGSPARHSIASEPFGGVDPESNGHGSNTNEEVLNETHVARIVSEHLVQPEELAEARGASPHSFGSVSHNLLGGEVTRDIYQWHEKREGTPSLRRRNSEPDLASLSIAREREAAALAAVAAAANGEGSILYGTTGGSTGGKSTTTMPPIVGGRVILRASDLREPGMFRRQFMQHRAERQGLPPPNFITSNFIDFLALYGFYGGDVYPSDDEDYGDESGSESDEEAYISGSGVGVGAGGSGGDDDRNDRPGMPPSESTPLVHHHHHHHRRRPPSVHSSGVRGTSAKKAFFMLMKAFVGTGVLFLPKAFTTGGLALSIILLVVIGYLTLHCMLLLVETSNVLGGSYGDIGEYLYGPRLRQLILGSIAVAQMGFCCTYYIFVATNLRDFVMVVSDCAWKFPDWFFILVQLLLYIPLSWVRRIKHFSITSLIADVVILLGLSYIMYYYVYVLSERGGEVAKDIVWFNWQSFPLFIGTALFAFEGICLILPIADSMKHPEKFSSVLSLCVLVIGVIFVVIGTMGYLTFGAKVETVIFLNLPRGSPVVYSLQFLYALAIMLSFPLTVYPAVRITEQAIFAGSMHDGKSSRFVKWQKNLYRATLVSFLAAVAIFGSDNLDKFVSLVGCFACIPLSFVYPSLFHFHISRNKWVKAKDIALVIFGTVATVYTTYVTLQQWVVSGPDTPKDRCEVTGGGKGFWGH